MNSTSVAFAVALVLGGCGIVFGEEQVTDASGRVIEIRQEYGDTTYAYDGSRNPIYTATRIPGGGGPLDYRDKHGVHVGVGGPGTLPGSVPGKW